MTLPVSRLVRVNVNLSPLAAATRSFGVLMVAGDSNVISGLERYRTYSDAAAVAADFGTTAPEYLASALYFGQTPKPATMMVGRWLRTATAGQLLGGILNASQQLIANFTSITSGGFTVSVDGTPVNVSSLNFSGAANLNAVAEIIQTGMSGTATCVWNGSYFALTSTTTGAGVKASGTVTLDTNPSPGVRASGTVTIDTNPTNGTTIVINGVTVTFVSGSPTVNQVLIGGDENATAANLQAMLAASATAGLAACTYNTLLAVTTITAKLYGTAGNAYTLTSSSGDILVSGAGTLTGGVAADTLTVNGTVVTFVATTPTGNQVLVGSTAAITAVNLNTFLGASANANIDDATYSVDGLVVTVTYKTVGTGGNAFSLAKSSSHITLSGANLANGAIGSSVGYATAPLSGTDISTLLKFTSALAQGLVPGYDAETPVECVAALEDMSSAWYGIMFAASTLPTIDQNMSVAAFVQALDVSRIFGVNITDTSVLSSLVTNDQASLLKDAGYTKSFCQYSANAYAIASFFGRAFSVNFNGNRTTITLMYKQEPGVVAENLSTTQANTLETKRCNVFVSYNNDTAIIQYGMMSGSAWFDEIHGLDWLQNEVQTNCYNLLYTSTTKIPQTDAGVNQIVNAIAAACDKSVSNGLSAPGVWNADGFGSLNRGDYLQNGYYIYAQPIALQSQSDREARISPPIQVATKLAGAIQEIDVIINVNR